MSWRIAKCASSKPQSSCCTNSGVLLRKTVLLERRCVLSSSKSTGLVRVSALAALVGQYALLGATGPAALLFTLAAWATRTMARRRNAVIKHKSTLQSATGIHSPNLVQKSMGMSAGSFNTREFFLGRTLVALKRVKLAFLLLCFALPAALALWGVLGGGGCGALPWALAALCQVPGLVAERWLFFAQAKHPQNLYYQVVS